MRSIRRIAAHTPAIVISVLAVALSVGGGAYASTHPHLVPGPSQGSIHTLKVAPGQGTAHSTVTSGVPWNSIVLQNGWTSSNATFGTGNPKVALQGNVVYLSGSLNQSSGTNNVFGFLPSTFRPTHNLYMPVFTFGGNMGTLYVGKDGTMEMFANTNCNSTQNNAQCFTSLASISYPINS
jgi:hypothetical protein